MSQFKKKLTAFSAMLAFLSCSTAALASAPDLIDSVGIEKYTKDGNYYEMQTTAGAHGAVSQADWNTFSLNGNEHFHFAFGGAAQTIINRVLGGHASEIYGKLTSGCLAGSGCTDNTGRVIFINPAGVLFGAGSQVDVSSLTVSTFDMKDAKNLASLNAAQRAAYQADVLNKISSLKSISGRSSNGSMITFDSNYTEAFEQAGTNYDLGQTRIIIDGAHFDNFADIDRGIVADENKNFATLFVSDNIEYKNSLIRTGNNFNYAGNYSYGNVKLVTADGVTFHYFGNGAIDGNNAQARLDRDGVDRYSEPAGKDAVQRTITMENSQIDSGSVGIYNDASVADGSNIKISNTYLKANKLINRENGDIFILGSDTIDLDNVHLETRNSDVNGSHTFDKNGGQVLITSNKDINIKNSLVETGGFEPEVSYADKAGAITVESRLGNVKVENSQLSAMGAAKIEAAKKATIKNSLVSSANTKAGDLEKRDTTINGRQGVEIENGVIYSKFGDVKISAADEGHFNGNVIITGDLKEDGSNKSTIMSERYDVSIQGNNTTIQNTSVAHQGDLHFYNDGLSGTNNVTVAGGTTFTKAGSSDINLTTNGNFILDNATLQTGHAFVNLDLDDVAGYSVSFTDRANADNISVGSTSNHVYVQNASDVTANKNITLTANNGSVSISGGSELTAGEILGVNAKNNATVSSSTLKGKNVNVIANNIGINNSSTINANVNANITAGTDASIISSKVEAGTDVNINSGNDLSANDVLINADNDVNINAKNSLAIKNSLAGVKNDKGVFAGNNTNIKSTNGGLHIVDATIGANKDVNITSFETITFGNKHTANIADTKEYTPGSVKFANIVAGKNINVKSTSGDINAEATTMPLLAYGNELTFEAQGSNNFTSEASLKSVNVNYIAHEGSNNFTTKDDIQFVNSSFTSANNNITTTVDGADVILNNLKINIPTGTNAKDVKTTIIAQGNVTNRDVTGSYIDDVTAKVHYYPQEAGIDFNVADALSKTGTPLDVNNTKLIVSTNVTKNAATPDNGSIVLDVVNAANKEAGIELSATNTGGWDQNSGVNQGPEIHINAADNKLAVSKIITDKLFTDANDKMYASDVTLTTEQLAGLPAGTPSKGYIEVRDYMGFNQDNDFINLPDPEDFDYTGHYVPSQIPTPSGIQDVNRKHTINFADTNEDFILVYDRPSECPPVDPGSGYDEVQLQAESYINQIKLPKEQFEISKSSKVSDNTVDQTSNIMSAAAKVDLGQDANETDTDEYDEEDIY